MKRFPLQLLAPYPRRALVDWLNALSNTRATPALAAVLHDRIAFILHLYGSNEKTAGHTEPQAPEFWEVNPAPWGPNREDWPARVPHEALCVWYEAIVCSSALAEASKAELGDGSGPSGVHSPPIPILQIPNGLVIIRPKERFFGGLNDLRDADKPIDGSETKCEPTAFLVPEFETDEEAWLFIRANYESILGIELYPWHIDEAWPYLLDYATFRDWFDVEVVSKVYQFVEDPTLDNEPEAIT